MSMPSFPECGIDITREQAFNMLLGSIAMEELALSHILNAEGEKLQYVLGTLPHKPRCAPSAKEVLEINQSVTTLLEHVAHNQYLLKGKLTQVLEAQERWNPHTPPCPTHRCNAEETSIFSSTSREICAGQCFSWRHIKGCIGKNMSGCNPTSIILTPDRTTFLVDFRFEVLPCELGRVSISLLCSENGSASTLLKSSTCVTSPNTTAFICGTTIVSPCSSPTTAQSIFFSLCEPQSVIVKKAQLTLAVIN